VDRDVRAAAPQQVFEPFFSPLGTPGYLVSRSEQRDSPSIATSNGPQKPLRERWVRASSRLHPLGVINSSRSLSVSMHAHSYSARIRG
jgi:hypothetical protein